MSFADCINAAVGDGVIEAEEGDELKRRYAMETRAAGGDRAAAKTELARKLDAEGVEKRRRKLLAAQAARQVSADIRSYRGADGKPDIVSAINRLFENVGHTGYGSVRGRFNALFGAALSEMGDALHQFRRGALDPRRRNAAVLDDVARAAFGEAADPKAKALYQAWLKPAEKLRQLFNEAGGAIGWRDGWGLPQGHDAGAVLRAKFEGWRAFIEPRLDWDKMRHPASDAPILPEERGDVLNHVWKSIVMDGWNTRDPSTAGGGRASLANARNDPRFLTFRDASAWLDYNRQFGRGNVYDVIMGHMKGLAKDAAAMQRLGPNPAATTQWLKQIVEQEGARYMAGDPTTFRPSVFTRLGEKAADNEVPLAIANANRGIDAMYEMARGGGTPRALVGTLFQTVQNIQTGAKLGSAVLVHAAINPLLEANARLHYGIPVASMLGDILKGFGGASSREIDQAGMATADAMHSLEQGAREAGAVNRFTKVTDWLPYAVTHYSGLEAGVTALRRAWWWGASSAVTNELDKAWDGVNPRLREMLTGFGIDEADWRTMQAATLYEPAEGAPFLRWQEIRDAGLDNHEAVGAATGHDTATPEGAIGAATAAERTAMKYLEVLHQSMEFAVPSSRWQSRAALTLGTREGTAAGYLTRSFAMFKGFVGSATVSYVEALRHELAGNKAVGASAAAANAIALTLLGTLVLQLKTMSNGKDPMSMDPATPEGRTTFLHGLMTSGAMSIMGDFLASDQSSYGHGPLETMAGPVVTSGLDAYGVVKGALTGKSKASDAGPAAVKFLRNNTPVLSTHWALRAAYDRILLDQLQYLADPNAHKSMRAIEDRVRKDTGQGYWWKPGEMAPSRFPQMTTGR